MWGRDSDKYIQKLRSLAPLDANIEVVNHAQNGAKGFQFRCDNVDKEPYFDALSYVLIIDNKLPTADVGVRDFGANSSRFFVVNSAELKAILDDEKNYEQLKRDVDTAAKKVIEDLAGKKKSTKDASETPEAGHQEERKRSAPR